MRCFIAIEEDLIGLHRVWVRAVDAAAARRKMAGQGRRIVQIQEWVEGWPQD